MSVLRILRNFAVLLTLAVAIRPPFHPVPVHIYACTPAGRQCPPHRPPCCPGLMCVEEGDRDFCESIR